MSGGPLGWSHNVFLDSAGAVWTIGCGNGGQIGHGDSRSSQTLQRVEGLPPCQMVSAGRFSTACVTQDGEVFCFGGNHMMQLGQHSSVQMLNTPHRVTGLPPIRSLASGPYCVVCLGVDASVWVFGSNRSGQLGFGQISSRSTIRQVTELAVRQVACGGFHTLFLTTHGDLYACGDDGSGQLGNGYSSVTAPTPIPMSCEIESVHCGSQYSVVRATDGALWCTGDNRVGQLGMEDTNERNQFTLLPNLMTTQVACGTHHTVAIDDSNVLWGWGWGERYQLSPITSYSTCRPTILREDVRLVLAGASHTLVLTTSDQVMVCGDNEYGQLADDHAGGVTSWTASKITADMMQMQFAHHVSRRPKSARSVYEARVDEDE